ncbi:MAG: DUF2891 domain-containing protein [Caulobacteraceae bacterium]
MHSLDLSTASRLARLALSHVEREHPVALIHVESAPGDLASQRALHPVFFGSFDWHSSVHTHWLLARVLRRFPTVPEAQAIRARLSAAFTPANVAAEIAYFERPTAHGFERPYGWAWLLKLVAELDKAEGDEARAWAEALEPLARLLARRFEAFLPRADYPVRAGVHSNTAFALCLALEWARGAEEIALEQLISAKARAWHMADADCQAWEPSGDDFLSPALVEAELMGRVLPKDEFRPWLARFLPRLGAGEPASLFAPPTVSDRSDGKIAHLDGLSLSRAWCWQGMAARLGARDPMASRAQEAAERHLEAGLAHLAGDYAGEHWLASFALLALEGAPGLGED